ncbi:MAG: ORF6N domain-containing protein [Paludibacter sp.]
MNEISQHQPSDIQNKIYSIRNQKVMLDFDLAELYSVETKKLNLSVKRNINRFPSDFMFQLNAQEWDSLRLQIETSKRGGRRYLPYAFTEQGVAMLSGLLNSDIAIEMNIAIMRSFVAIRQLILKSPDQKINELQTEIKELKAYIEDVFTDYNDINEDTRMQMELINQSLAELHTDKKILSKPRKKIGFITEE